jgi:molybdopterin-guanine dinucleotide biosynthesis protein A
VLDQVTRFADDVLLVASNRPAYARFGVPIVPDLHPGTGVLGAIASALAAARHAHCLVVACDLPFLNPALLRWMVEQPRDYDVLVPRLPGRSRQGDGWVYQTLHAIYGKGCQAAINERLAEDRLQVIGFFPAVIVRPIGPDVIERLDPTGHAFFNANEPAAAAAARRLIEQGTNPGP